MGTLRSYRDDFMNAEQRKAEFNERNNKVCLFISKIGWTIFLTICFYGLLFYFTSTGGK